MNVIFFFIVALVMMVWYIRPLYNFFAKRKYTLLNDRNLTLSKKVQSGLPAVIFYTIIVGLMLYPAFTTNLINTIESGSLVVGELILIFIITRIDKRQTKYTVSNEGLFYRGKKIIWSDKHNITFKRTILLVLHKPRFIVKSKHYTIVVPVLSRNISKFISNVKENNYKDAILIEKIYNNIKDYYVTNIGLSKRLNK